MSSSKKRKRGINGKIESKNEIRRERKKKERKKKERERIEGRR
jgi:hypothetical protein